MIPPLMLDAWRIPEASSVGVAAEQRAGKSRSAATKDFMENINPGGAGWLHGGTVRAEFGRTVSEGALVNVEAESLGERLVNWECIPKMQE